MARLADRRMAVGKPQTDLAGLFVVSCEAFEYLTQIWLKPEQRFIAQCTH